MQINKINFRDVSNKKNFQRTNANFVSFQSLSSTVKLVGSKKTPLLERLLIARKWLAGLYNVKTDGEYVLKKYHVPYNLQARKIIIPEAFKIKGNYHATDSIEISGTTLKNSEMRSDGDILINANAKIFGKTKSLKKTEISGIIADTGEVESMDISIGYLGKVDGQAKASSSVYISGIVSNGAKIKGREVRVENEADILGYVESTGPAYISGGVAEKAEIQAEVAHVYQGAKIDGKINATKSVIIEGNFLGGGKVSSGEGGIWHIKPRL